MDHSTDYSDPELKKLLNSWKMEHIYEHLVEHKINLKILKILQSKHIDRLFENLPVGEQAIFEHRWDIWKRTMLLEDHTPAVKPTEIVEGVSSEKLEASVKETTSSTSRSTPVEKTQLINTPFVETTPLVCKTPTNENSQMSETYVTNDSQDDIVDELLETMEPLPQTFHISSRPQRSFPPLNRSYHHTPPSLLRVSHTSSIPSSVVAHTPPPPPPPMPMDAVKITLTQPNPTHVRYSLSRILHETSGGQVILNYYEKHKILREEHRTALINVIARYIDANGCTLSLSESNNLENQIVEMFPTEREEFYRTGKRGRLYNKIANMKRVYKKFKKDTAELNQSASGPSSPASGGSVISKYIASRICN